MNPSDESVLSKQLVICVAAYHSAQPAVYDCQTGGSAVLVRFVLVLQTAVRKWATPLFLAHGDLLTSLSNQISPWDDFLDSKGLVEQAEQRPSGGSFIAV